MSDHPVFDDTEHRALHGIREAGGWFTGHLHHASDSSQQEEQVTTPQQPRNVLADIASLIGQVADNKLIAGLVGEGLGTALAAADVDHVLGIVRAVENGNRAAAAMAQAQQQHDSAQFPAAEQHQQ